MNNLRFDSNEMFSSADKPNLQDCYIIFLQFNWLVVLESGSNYEHSKKKLINKGAVIICSMMSNKFSNN